MDFTVPAESLSLADAERELAALKKELEVMYRREAQLLSRISTLKDLAGEKCKRRGSGGTLCGGTLKHVPTGGTLCLKCGFRSGVQD
jgi:hypothetical protein